MERQVASRARATRSSVADSMDREPFRLGYRPWLDGLRGIAVLAVLAYHLFLLPCGALGVDVFFVLSGFLITALLAEEWQNFGSIRLTAFYWRRALRLLPPLLLLVAVLWVSCWWLPKEAAIARRWETLIALSYIANWHELHQTSMPTLGHTWSLSVEEQFYLLWPLLLIAMLRWGWPQRRILLTVASGIALVAVYRYVLYDNHPPTGPGKQALVMRLYFGSDTRADALLVGCLVGLLAVWNRLPRSPRFVGAMSAGALVSVGLLIYIALYRTPDHSQFYRGLFTVVAAMVAVILVRLLVSPARFVLPVLQSMPLVYVGRISYGLYLFHMPILRYFETPNIGRQHPTTILLVLSATFAAAVVSYHLLERPCLRLKNLVGRGAPELSRGRRLVSRSALLRAARWRRRYGAKITSAGMTNSTKSLR